MGISLDTTLVASKKQVAAELADEVVMLNLEDGEYYGLNAVGAHVWAALQEPTSVRAVRDSLLREYPDVDADQCTRDTVALLEDMLGVSLIEVVGEGAG